jgi:uncharacterized protein YqiB (DUF1249 family)
MSLARDAGYRRPSRIAVLMELYERNFLLLEQLVPELELPFNEASSTSETDPPLHLITLERSPYTSSFRLTYQLDGRCEPDMWVKVYRDARLAETLFCAARPRWLAEGEGDPQADRYLGEQWSRNLTLHKWLQYLLEQGHGFGMAARPRRAER